MAFDPAAATAAYLSALPPEAHAKATAYTQGGHWLLLWGVLIGIAAALIVLKLGLLRKLQAWLERRKPRPWITALVLSFVYFLATSLITGPWAAYTDWARERAYGLSSQPFAGWAIESLIKVGISSVVAGVLLMLVYWVMRRSARLWPVWTGVLVAVFILFTQFLAPIFIEPIFNTYREAPPGPVREMVVQMGEKVGVPTDKIYISDYSKQTNRYTANVSGLFGTARVAMSDTMFTKGADLAEV